MDSEMFTQILALVTAAWTMFQEYRHRKAAKSAEAAGEEAVKAKPGGGTEAVTGKSRVLK